MEKYRLEVTDVIADEFDNIIGGGLNDFNDTMTGISDRQPLAIVVRDAATGVVQGGMLGRTSLGLLFIDLFYLPEFLRGNGLGAEILRRFEAEGAKRGCCSAVLYTISFQAPEFYAKHGWTRFGAIPCLPAGTSRIFMTKTL